MADRTYRQWLINLQGWDTYRSDNVVIQDSVIVNTDECVYRRFRGEDSLELTPALQLCQLQAKFNQRPRTKPVLSATLLSLSIALTLQ